MKKFEFLEHPADLKIRAWGKDLPELFANAALGMMSFIYPDCRKACKISKKEQIHLKASDLKSLLVDWLSELLYLSDANDICSNKFDFKEVTEKQINAEVFGCKSKAKEDIKAVTYHGLSINKTKSGWQAIILFDI